MKAKPYRQEIIYLVCDFIENEMGESDIADSLRQKHLSSELPTWVFEGNLLIQKGLIKAVKNFVQLNEKVKQYYLQRKSKQNKKMESQQEQEADSQPMPQKKRKTNKSNDLEDDHHPNTSHWIKNKFLAPKKLEDVDVHKIPQSNGVPDNDESSVQSQKRATKSNKKKTKKVVDQSEQPEQQEKKPQKQSKKTIKHAKRVEKKLSDDDEEESQEQKQKKTAKKVVKNIKKVSKKIQDSEDNEEQEEQSEKPKKQTKKEVKNLKKVQKNVSDEQQQEEEKPIKNRISQKKETEYTNGKVQRFSRINPDEVGFIKEQLQDNSFGAKFKYGKGGDQWGKYGYEKLKDTRGDSFKKTKGKLKNKAFQGGNIDFNAINSIPL